MNNFLRNDGKKMMIQKGKNPIRIVLGHNGLASLKPASTTALGQWREELVIDDAEMLTSEMHDPYTRTIGA